MKTKNVLFRMAARCEAAGRPNNEDNYQIDADLSDDKWGFTADAQVELGKKGALLVVCDGMGGMNAGEVASAIAVETIKSRFAAEQLTDAVLTEPMAYIKNAIVAADTAIKKHGKEHPDTAGMGSTIVLAWLLGKKVYVGWCGDSRCYCYNSKTGLVRLSHDHSYVQELVDAGKLTEELAFDHPNNNIITRSLGDPNGTARPDVKEYDLHNEDILLLCSDGLCGCLRDNEIEEQLAAHQTSMQECRDALWVADEAAGWHDNVTVALAQVINGAMPAVSVGTHTSSSSDKELLQTNKRLKIIIAVLAVLLVAILAVAAYNPAKRFIKEYKCFVLQDSIANPDTQNQSAQLGTPKSDEDVGTEAATTESAIDKSKSDIGADDVQKSESPEASGAGETNQEKTMVKPEEKLPKVKTTEQDKTDVSVAASGAGETNQEEKPNKNIPEVKKAKNNSTAASAAEQSAEQNLSTDHEETSND